MGAKKFRYPGTTYFQCEDEPIFCGRDAETNRLYTQVLVSRTLVLHADSGVGKSSLIEAGLLPQMKRLQPDYFPFTVRFDFKKVTADTAELPDNGNEALLVEGTLNKLLSVTPTDIKNSTLPYLDSQPVSLWSVARQFAQQGKKLLLIFDQFEELQQYSQGQIDYFAKALHELLAQEPPAYVEEEIKKASLSLFEETEPSPDARELYNANTALLRQPLDTRVLFVVREDKLGTMSLLGQYFPDILKNDFRLEPLTVEATAEAIVNPASKRDGCFHSPTFTFLQNEHENVVDHIIGELVDPVTGLVDPLQVQIVCRNVERTVVLHIQDDQMVVRKTEIGIADMPPIKNILQDYYDECWESTRKLSGLSTADFHKKKRRIISELVVGSRRNLVHEGLLTDPVPMKEELTILDNLVREGLFRKLVSGKDNFYQLCHDRFIRPVQEDLRKDDDREKVARQQEEDRRKNKRKRIYFSVIGTFLAIASIVGFLFAAAKRQERMAREDKILTVASMLRRENPTLSYGVALQWNTLHKNDKRITQFLTSFDTLQYAYLLGIIPTLSSLQNAEVDPNGSILTVTESYSKARWDLDRKAWLDGEMRDGKYLLVFRNNNDSYALLSRNDSLLLLRNNITIRSFPEDAISLDGNIAAAPTGNYLLLGNTIYNYLTGALIGKLPQYPINKDQMSALFLNDGKHLVVGYWSGLKMIFRIDEHTNGKKIKLSAILPPAKDHENTVITSLAVDTRDRWLVAGNREAEVEVWQVPNLRTGDSLSEKEVASWFDKSRPKPLRILTGHNDNVNCVRISPNDSMVLSGSKDYSAILWDLQSGRKLAILKGRNAAVSYCSFSPDGKILMTGAENILYLWSREQPRAIANRIARLSPLDYYNVELGKDDEFRPLLFDTTTLRKLYDVTFNYILNFPSTNRYPDDPGYLKQLKTGLSEIDDMYHRLVTNKYYPTIIKTAERKYLLKYYNDLQDNRPYLLLKTAQENDSSKYARATQMLKHKAEMLLTDTSNISEAITIAVNLKTVSLFYQDSAKDVQTSMNTLRFALDLLAPYKLKNQLTPNGESLRALLYLDLGYCHVLLNRFDSARYDASQLANLPKGKNIADLLLAETFLVEGKPEQAQAVIANNRYLRTEEDDPDFGTSLRMYLWEKMKLYRTSHSFPPSSVAYIRKVAPEVVR